MVFSSKFAFNYFGRQNIVSISVPLYLIHLFDPSSVSSKIERKMLFQPSFSQLAELTWQSFFCYVLLFFFFFFGYNSLQSLGIILQKPILAYYCFNQVIPITRQSNTRKFHTISSTRVKRKSQKCDQGYVKACRHVINNLKT